MREEDNRYESQESVFHLYSTTLHKTMSQGITVAAYPFVGNDPEPFGVAFPQDPPFTLMISLTLSNSSYLSMRLELLLN